MKSILIQIRNEWRSSLFLFTELLLVFVVLWYIVDWTLVTLRVYHAPLGFDTEHCYNITVGRLTPKSAAYQSGLTVEDDMRHLTEIAERLRHRPGVEAVALSQNCFPYNDGSNGVNLGVDTVAEKTHLLWVEPDFFRVFRYGAEEDEQLERMASAIREGRMVVSSNLFARHPQLHLDSEAALLDCELALLNFGSDVRRRVGAVGMPTRWSHFYTTSEWGGSYAALHLDLERLVQYGNPQYITLSLRLRPDEDMDFKEKLTEDADRLYRVGNLYLLDVTSFEDLREICEREDMNEAKTWLCVLGFLLMNIFLGVIGTFRFRTQQRRKEVALRMAMGSSRRAIFSRLMGEGILLLTLAALPGIVVAFNIGMAELIDTEKLAFTTGRLVTALAATWVLMVLMIVAGIWYPARKAMQVQPAEALHDE